MKQRVVIVGSGWAGYSLFRSLRPSFFDISLVSQRNHFTFTPLLCSTCVGTIDFRSVIEPVRTHKSLSTIFWSLFGRKKTGPDTTPNHFVLGSFDKVDLAAREITVSTKAGNTARIPYDVLVLAMGMQANDLGIPGVKEHAFFLKEIEDARDIRQRIITCFEKASAPGCPPEEKKRLLHFMVVGGGPTGVEFAAELSDLVRIDIPRAFPEIDVSRDVRISLYTADFVLGSFHEKLRKYAENRFKLQGIDVVKTQGENRIVEVTETGLRLANGTFVPTGITVWSTGIKPQPVIEALPFEKKNGRIVTDPNLQVVGHPEVYAAGDCAYPSTSLPATAQVASQEGAYIARRLNALAQGQKPAELEPFVFRNRGMLAYIGGYRALVDTPAVKSGGFGEWIFWRSAYLTNLVSIRNKVMVPWNWTTTFLFGRDLSRFGDSKHNST